MNLLAIKTTNPDAVNQIYNTACGERTTISHLAELTKAMQSKIDSNIASVEVKYRSIRLGDIPHSQASIEKAKRLLGYVPLVNFTEGLEETIKWYYSDGDHSLLTDWNKSV